MSEPENFVARWSRLKRETAKPASAEPIPPSQQQGAEFQEGEQPGPAASPAEPNAPAGPTVDLKSLPPIESITAGSDIRSFLQSGVPAELTKAALRRAWTSDPAIRDFIGIAENQWDFTDPAAMPGFGPLEAADDVRQLVSQAMGRWGTASERVAEGLASETPVASSQAPPSEAAAKSSRQASGMPGGICSEADAANSSPEQKQVNAAPQQGPEPAENGATPNRRAHGTALPQ